MKKSKYFLMICLALSFILISPLIQTKKVFAEDYLKPISAKTMVVIEQNSKRVLLEKYKDIQLPMASTTKVMTALSVLKRCENLDTKIKIDSRAVGIEGTSMYLKKDEVLSIKDLLSGMLAASGNDAACALALHFSKTLKDFANIMNSDAKEIGAVSSNFMNPHGLDEKGHFTTAYDLALIMSEAMNYSDFREIVSKKTITVAGQEKDRVLVNKNKLLGNYENCTGGKIGFTDNAGRCLVSTASKNGLDLVCVVLNSPDMFKDSIALFDYCFNNYIYTQLLEPYKIHKTIIVENGKESEVKVYTKQGFNYPLSLDETMELSFDYDIPSSVKAPVQKEQVVGRYKISLGDKIIFEEDIYATDEVQSIEFSENMKEIASNW